MDDNGIPNLLRPIQPHPKDGSGRMIEEWELCANENTRRIMGRQCFQKIAKRLLSEDGKSVYVTGRQGSGKTCALLSMVASARLSGHIVLFLPDGHRLSEHGYYIEPNSHLNSRNEQLFDLPVLSQEICGQLMQSHEQDLERFHVPYERLEQWMSKKTMTQFMEALGRTKDDDDEDDEKEDPDSITLTDVLKIGSTTENLAAACYNVAIDTLMNQTDQPFTVVLDEFNCYFDRGHYFHMDYDPSVRKSIPPHKINLFRPFINAMGVQTSEEHVGAGNLEILPHPMPMKRGGIVVAITESHAIKRRYTNALTDAMKMTNVTIVDVPPFSPLEVEHILANFEITGIGRLRFDRGETIMNEQEVAYLRMVSGGYGQSLLDACIM